MSKNIRQKIMCITMTMIMMITYTVNGYHSLAKEYEGKDVAVYLNDNFDDAVGVPPGWAVYGADGDNAFVRALELEEGEGKSARITINDLDGHNLNFVKELSEYVAGDLIYEFKLRVNRTDFFAPLFQATFNNGEKVNFISLGTDGYLTVLGEKIEQVTENKWYHLALYFNTNTCQYEFYLDGEKRVALKGLDERIKDQYLKSFKAYVKGQAEKNYDMYLDDVRLYSHAEPIFDESFFNDTQDPDPGTGGDGSDDEDELSPELKERLQNALVYVTGRTSVYANNAKENLETAPVATSQGIYVPALYTISKLGYSYSWDEDNETLYVIDTSNTTTLASVTYDQLIIDSEDMNVKEPLKVIHDKMYLLLDTVEWIFNKYVFLDENTDLIIISDEEDILDKDEDGLMMEELIKLIIYDRPSAEKILQDFNAYNPNNEHPRLFITKDKINSLKKDIQSNEELGLWYNKLIKEADNILEKPVGKYELPDGRRLLSARDARPYIETTALAYLLSGEEKYKNRAIAEMEAVIEFPDWNHQREFLNTSEMAAGVALGYDWLYDELSEQQRLHIRNALVEKGLNKALDAYANKAWWSQPRELINNWNAVCNGGIGMAALAIIDEEDTKEVASKTLQKALRSLENGILLKFGPDGAWGEGPGYWKYTIEYIISIMACMESALGTTYGHDSTPGLKETAFYPLYLTGPQGIFNYADASYGAKMKIPELFYMAKVLDNPDISKIRLDMMKEFKQSGRVYDLIWYDNDLVSEEVTLPLDKYFRGVELAVFRSQWSDPYANYVGFKSGKGYMSHGHMDVGNFVFHANGEQWAIDLGSDDYGLKDYFDYNGRRFQYYRMKPEGHNTVVIGSDDQFQQDPFEINRIDRFQSKPKGGFAITDMTAAYQDKVKKVERGVMLTDNRRVMVVQDEIQMRQPEEYWWFMHTKADIEIDESGQNAVLTQNGKKLWATIVTSEDDNDGIMPTFIEMEAKPYLQESPVTDIEKTKEDENVGIKKLAIHLDKVKNVKMAVVLIPLEYGEDEPSYVPEFKHLRKWRIEDGPIDIPTLDAIRFNGQPLENFKSTIYSYDMNLPFGTTNVPTVEVDSSYDVDTIEAKSLLEPTIIMVKNDKGEKTTYTIRFSILPKLNKPDGLKIIPVTQDKVSASDEQVVPEKNQYNYAINTVDGDYNTLWAAEGQQWIQYDMGQVKNISSVGIAFSRGNQRSFKFEVETSLDGENWEKVALCASSAKSLDMEYFGFIEKEARYIRIQGKGNTTNGWNSYCEVELFEQ